MSDTDRDHTPGSQDPARPGETPNDPAYAAGAGFTGEASGATPPDPAPTAGPDPLGGGAAATDPTTGSAPPRLEKDAPSTAGGFGGGTTGAGPTTTTATGSGDDKTMVLITHAANIAGPFTGGLGNLGAIILAFVKKDTAPEWARTHYVFAIRTVVIAVVAAIALAVLAMIAVPLSFIGIGLLMFPLIGLAGALLTVWIIVRSAVGLVKAADNQPYPNPETWLI